MADQPDHWTTAKTKDGMYTGNQQFSGLGVVRYCLLCKAHRPQGGGGMRTMFGMKHWVCQMHKKPKEQK